MTGRFRIVKLLLLVTWVVLALPTAALAATPAGEPPSVSAAASLVHIVRPGESLAGIAARYGVSSGAIARANSITNLNYIWVGQRLLIPTSSVPAQPPVLPPSGSGSGEHWIEINVSRQTLTAWQGSRAVLNTSVSTGLAPRYTVLGTFRTYIKLSSQRMIGPGYDLPGVPWVMYFYADYAIHGTYWHNNFGHPMSHGCVNMRISEAQWLYNWAPMGTRVWVHA